MAHRIPRDAEKSLGNTSPSQGLDRWLLQDFATGVPAEMCGVREVFDEPA